MKSVLLIALVLLAVSSRGADLAVRLVEVTPTPFFPKPAAGTPLRQQVVLTVDNPGAPLAAAARITVGGSEPETQPLGTLASGPSKVPALLPDLAAPAPVTIELLAADGRLLATRKQDWQPQKKWTLYCCSYSHQDLGFGDYPHRLRTSNRHENMKLPLRFCRETEDWPEESQYRYNLETGEPLTSFISFCGKEAGLELGRRVREGRIAISGLHNTIMTEELSHELMARLFYISSRHAVDLLGVPASTVMQQDDVIGLSWPTATYAKEAGLEYCFHGFNRLSMPNLVKGQLLSDFRTLDGEFGQHIFSIGNEPNFYWQGPDGQHLLRRATTYERNGLLDNPYQKNRPDVQDPARVEFLIQGQERIKWPFNAMLSQDGGDFMLVTRTIANRARKWNADYEWPRLRPATFADYFHAIEREIAEKKIPLNTVAADENDLWSDQNYTVARTTAQARRLTESLPATETLAALAQMVAGGGDQWINLFQAYHRLLAYYEHTNAKNDAGGNMIWYETELAENREMVTEAGDYQARAFTSATQRLAGEITRTGERSLIVFNTLPQVRTDIVRADIPAPSVTDSVTGRIIPVQQLPDGSAVFLAEDLPATGYKVFSLGGARPDPAARPPVEDLVVESKYYKVTFHPASGAIVSLFDKELGIELVATNAANAFNGYLYQSNGKWSALEKADGLAVERGLVADVFTMTGRAPGVEALKQTVILYHDLKRIDFAVSMDKSPHGGKEAVFVALPFNVPGFAIRHELPGCVIEPYRQQVEGSATSHYSIRSFTDLSNEKYGVTVSPVEGSLVCYGGPQPTPQPPWHRMNRSRECPTNSWLYLYLMNNMFSVNTSIDQRGPVSFTWSLRSHAGNWQAGRAQPFGRSVQQPLLAWRADGRHTGALPAAASFMTVDAPNVMCSVIKPAEANGRGYIIRLNETSGKETTATVSLPLLPAIESVMETSLVENDRNEIGKGNTFKVTLRPFGVRTLRVTCAGAPSAVSGFSAKAVADMQVDLSWSGEGAGHFNIYRDTQPACVPSQLNFIGQAASAHFVDLPRPNIGGWLRSCLAPQTTYYYRVVAVDRANNPGAPGAVVPVTTLSSEKANLPPVAVEGVRPILVSPLTADNFVNILFRTACEPDVMQYEIFRGTASGTGEVVGVVNNDDFPPRSGGYGESPIKYKNREYDHAFFTDLTVRRGMTYLYRVRAVDAAGQRGAFSEEVAIRSKDQFVPGSEVTAQSNFEPRTDPELALDGNPDPFHAWISKQYGGGTKAEPQDAWWAITLPGKPVTIRGVKIIGDNRPVVPIQQNLQVQIPAGDAWKTVGELKNATSRDAVVPFAAPVITSTLRVYFPAAGLPQDGYARICELLFVMADGTEKGVAAVRVEGP